MKDSDKIIARFLASQLERNRTLDLRGLPVGKQLAVQEIIAHNNELNQTVVRFLRRVAGEE